MGSMGANRHVLDRRQGGFLSLADSARLSKALRDIFLDLGYQVIDPVRFSFYLSDRRGPAVTYTGITYWRRCRRGAVGIGQIRGTSETGVVLKVRSGRLRGWWFIQEPLSKGGPCHTQHWSRWYGYWRVRPVHLQSLIDLCGT